MAKLRSSLMMNQEKAAWLSSNVRGFSVVPAFDTVSALNDIRVRQQATLLSVAKCPGSQLISSVSLDGLFMGKR